MDHYTGEIAMSLITTTAAIVMKKEDLQQFLANLEEVEKLCEGRLDLASQIHYIAQKFRLHVEEQETNAILCPDCGSIYCFVWREGDQYVAVCKTCEHRSTVEEPDQEVKAFLDAQKEEDRHMDEEIYQVFREGKKP